MSFPAAFVAHGAPLLATDEVRGAPLRAWGAKLPRPTAILVVSAHWRTRGPTVGATETLSLVYDFGGFPEELYRLKYPAPGAPELAERVVALTGATRATARGLDHGVWVPLLHLFPEADVPVLQLSLPVDRDPYDLGRALAPLREEGVLVLGSGVLVHNLGAVDWTEAKARAKWATDFDRWVADALLRGDHDALKAWRRAPGASLAHPTDEHFTPLLVAAGAAGTDAPVTFPVEGFEYGTLSRRCVQFG